MRKTLSTLFLAVAASLLFFSCAGTLQNYNPKSVEGQEIKDALTLYESAYNSHDSQQFLGFFLDNAEIMSPKDGSMITKAQYADMISSLFEQYPTVVLGKPSVYVLETKDKAVVEVSMLFTDYQLVSKVSFLKGDNQWHITKLIYF
jgi:hypothetical protein